MKQVWRENGKGCVLMKHPDGWHISYNGELKNHYLQDETALVSEANDYYIIYGDHREQLEKLYPSWDKAYNYLYENRELQAASSQPIAK